MPLEKDYGGGWQWLDLDQTAVKTVRAPDQTKRSGTQGNIVVRGVLTTKSLIKITAISLCIPEYS